MKKLLILLFLLEVSLQFCFAQTQPLPISQLIEIYNNPSKYPNYIMVSAHRGYWKDYPENSLPAIQAAIDLGADMVEFDITTTDDGTLYLLHDWGLDRLTNGHGIVKKRISGDFVNYKSWDELKNVKLRLSTGEVTQYKLATLREALSKCKDKVLVSIDKAENIIPEMYYMVKELGMTEQVTFKTKIQVYPTPESIKQLVKNKEDQELLIKMFTPTIFNEAYEKDPKMVDKMKAFIDAGCTGFEMIYFKDTDKMLTQPINVEGQTYQSVFVWLKVKNRRVIQFPEWPENEKGNWSPAAYKFRNIDLTGNDRRCDWDWLLKTSHAPDIVISDRLEVLFDYLNTIGKRSLD